MSGVLLALGWPERVFLTSLLGNPLAYKTPSWGSISDHLFSMNRLAIIGDFLLEDFVLELEIGRVQA